MSTSDHPLSLLLDAFGCFKHATRCKYDHGNHFVDYLVKAYNETVMEHALQELAAGSKRQARVTFMLHYNNELIMHDMPRNFSWVIVGRIEEHFVSRAVVDIRTRVQFVTKRFASFMRVVQQRLPAFCEFPERFLNDAFGR